MTKNRGFTLIELLVAITAGVAVAAAAILLARNAVRLFQEESRISYTQVAVSLGMKRLGADLEMAGRKTTKNPTPTTNPNISDQRDPRICARPGFVDWPDGMRRLAPVIIEPMTVVPPQIAANGLKPERITIAGDIESGDNFALNTINFGAGGLVLVLQQSNEAVQRIRALSADGDPTTRLQQIFRKGRIIRIEGDTHDYYGVISGITITGNPIQAINVQLSQTPEVPVSPTSTLACAAKGLMVGKTVHVISRVLYEIRSLTTDPQYANYVAATNQVTGDDGRTELVRVELDAADNEMPGTLELIAEYAIDLRFGIKAVNPIGNANNPTLLRYPIEDPSKSDSQIYKVAGAPTESGTSPETLRAVEVRLSTRSRAPHRPVNVTAPPGRPYRFLVSTALTPEKYARVRTLTREFTLYNLMEGGL